MKVVNAAEWNADWRRVRPHLAKVSARTHLTAHKAYPSAVAVILPDQRIVGFESAKERDAFVKHHRSAKPI